jgi:hypothetical protein
VELILCDEKGDAVVHYILENLPNKILSAEYETVLPGKRHIEKNCSAPDAQSNPGNPPDESKKAN